MPNKMAEARRPLKGVLIALVAAAGLSAHPVHAATPCTDLVDGEAPIASREIQANDLLRLRDIGYSSLVPGQQLLGLAPDSGSIAFVMYRGDPATNRYCEAVLVLPLQPGAKPRVIDQSTELMLQPLEIRGVKVDYGIPTATVPQWSPDGKWLAYLKRENGETQVWRAPAAGGAPQIMTHSAVGVDAFAWSKDGKSLIYADRPGLLAEARKIDAEARDGYLYDDRVVPYSSLGRPAVTLPQPYRFSTVDLATGKARAASAAEAGLVAAIEPTDLGQAMPETSNSSGARAWAERTDPEAFLSTIDLWAEGPAGRKVKCSDPACTFARRAEIGGLWWSANSKEVVFIRREGWGDSQTAVYAWRPGAARAKRLLLTDDLLLGCLLDNSKLLCAREGSVMPRRLVSIDLKSGRSQTLFDPNPDFAALQLGSVERLHWRNANGVESFGDLVLPPRYRAGEKLPLIVVQYLSTGFLRGGIGNEYPIQLFAKAGYAVLSFQAPSSFKKWDGSKEDVSQALAEAAQDWSSRRNILSSLKTGIALLKERGVIDATKIGISGVSDGSTTIQFALINAPGLFKVASVGSCCVDPTSFMIYGGTGLEASFRQDGYPPARGPGSSAWSDLSLALNASKIHVPFLMNLADHEYLISLDTYMSLKKTHDPVEMRIFPNEYHIKWQPAHTAVLYESNLDWFNFWLRGLIDPDPAKKAQYERWGKLKAEASVGSDAPTSHGSR